MREKELAALTEDITLSETRQRELKHQIDTIDRHRDALNADLLRTAQRVHSLEEELSATEARLLRLHENADTVRASLHERRDVLAEVLATLERIGRRPPPALAVKPKDALGAVRSAMLLNAVMPGIHDEAEALSVDLAELTKLEGSIASERDRLKSDGSRLAEEKTRIELLIKAKREEADESRRKLAEETTRSQGPGEEGDIAQGAHRIAGKRDRIIAQGGRGRREGGEGKRRQAEEPGSVRRSRPACAGGRLRRYQGQAAPAGCRRDAARLWRGRQHRHARRGDFDRDPQRCPGHRSLRRLGRLFGTVPQLRPTLDPERRRRISCPACRHGQD